jgi:hypothetical protein
METTEIQLFWLPLGAGGRSVRWNGRVFEALAARHEHRAARDIYHSALALRSGEDRYVIEMAPAWSRSAADRGVVCTGPVGLRRLGRSVLFRYEVRLWRDGVIPDVGEAVGGPTYVDTDAARTRRLLAAVLEVPAVTWGRDELGLGEMWNSNSLVSWLLATSGHDILDLHPPVGGRAPGWDAGLRLAARSGRVQDRGQLLDAVDQPGAGTGPGGVGVDGMDRDPGRKHARRHQ